MNRKEKWEQYWSERDLLLKAVAEARKRLEDFERENRPDPRVVFSVCPVMVRETKRQKYKRVFVNLLRNIPRPGDRVTFTNGKSRKVVAVDFSEDPALPFFWLTLEKIKDEKKRVRLQEAGII